MNRTELKREQRLETKLDRLGVNDPRCHHCGEDSPHCLERHHIAGRANHDDTIIECRNCHAKLSDMAKDHPLPHADTTNQRQIIGKFLLGIADLFELLIKRLREFGIWLVDDSNHIAMAINNGGGK